MKVIKQVLHYLAVYKRYLGGRLYIVFILMALAAIMEAIGITMVIPLIASLDVSGVGEGSAQSEVQEALQRTLDWFGLGDSVVGIILVIALVFIGKGVILFAAKAYQAHLQAQLMRELKALVFEQYCRMDYGYYCAHNTGHFVNIINGQINGFVTAFMHFKMFLGALVTTGILFVTSFLVAWQFALMAVVAGIVIFALFKRLNKYVHKLSRKTAAEKGHLNKMIVQTMQSFKYLSSTAELDSLGKGVMQSVERLVHFIRNKGIAQALTEALKEPLAICLMLLIVIVQIVILEAPLLTILVALILFYRAIRGIMSMQSKWQKTLAQMGSFDMVEKELAKLASHQEPDGNLQISDFSRSIELRDVTFGYGKSGASVIKNISLTIPANTSVAFVGESGAGKSTLVDMLTLLLRPQSGEILVDGVPSDQIELASWRQQIGYISQESVIFDDTVANNICMWKDDYQSDPVALERIEDAARLAYADHFIKDLPDGYNTVVGDRGVRLSGGQRQRLFLARELYKQPRLLILDEATSALDSESEKYIQESIDGLKGRMTVVIIAHRLSTIKEVDQIHVLVSGRLVESGQYDALCLRSGGKLKQLVKIQGL